ncbi:MAG: sigma-70 family RNA polymerase sigma factor [Rhodospirillaceae bacterium]|nr:sigma-70 family RNA polymerase sigma factor [Rhodospirillaceae bacterium]
MARPIDELEGFIPSLRRYARSLTHDADQADDLVQETLLKAIGNIDRFDPETNLRAWLFTILLNTFKSQRRMAARRGVHVEWEDTADQSVQPPVQDLSMELKAFARAIEELPGHERETLMLVALEGFSYGEAAAVLGTEIGTVKSRVSRARAKLRDFDDADSEPSTPPPARPHSRPTSNAA